MTHNDIYTKFMIEYDKANVTSSYPSLTEYEVATVLDKAYNALIALKVTGNNYRRVPFEADVKAISDLQPLVISAEWGRPFSDNAVIKNQLDFKIPDDFLYYVGCRFEGELYKASQYVRGVGTTVPKADYTFDGVQSRYVPQLLWQIPIENTPTNGLRLSSSVSTSDVKWRLGRLINTYNSEGVLVKKIKADPRIFDSLEVLSAAIDGTFNVAMIWINIPDDQNIYTSYGIPGSSTNPIELTPINLYWSRPKTRWDDNYPYDQEVYRTLPCQIVDYNTAQRFFTSAYNMPWIKNPVCYIHGDWLHVVHEDDTISNYIIEKCVLTYIKKPASFVKHLVQGELNKNFFDLTPFELNETMAEELISLGIAYALENIESPRLNSKLNMRGLEA